MGLLRAAIDVVVIVVVVVHDEETAGSPRSHKVTSVGSGGSSSCRNTRRISSTHAHHSYQVLHETNTLCAYIDICKYIYIYTYIYAATTVP